MDLLKVVGCTINITYSFVTKPQWNNLMLTYYYKKYYRSEYLFKKVFTYNLDCLPVEKVTQCEKWVAAITADKDLKISCSSLLQDAYIYYSLLVLDFYISRKLYILRSCEGVDELLGNDSMIDEICVSDVRYYNDKHKVCIANSVVSKWTVNPVIFIELGLYGDVSPFHSYVRKTCI